MKNPEEKNSACNICGTDRNCKRCTTPPQPKEWEEEFNLILAQAHPFTLLGQYKDADFPLIKSFIRNLVEKTREEERQKCGCFNCNGKRSVQV
jgi:hypothetical protein